MNFNDIFKSSFVDNVSGFSLIDSGLALGVALLVGFFIYLTYKKTFMGVMYSRSFNISLISLTFLTTFVILAVTSNVVLSLGMVGALSIVRFRTAIKDPMDLVFLFWSIASGIVIGAGMIPLAIVASIIMGMILVYFSGQIVSQTPYIFIANCDDENVESKVMKSIDKRVSKYQIKSKSVTPNSGIELILEVRVKNGETDFVNEVSKIVGVSNTSLVSYNGDYVV